MAQIDSRLLKKKTVKVETKKFIINIDGSNLNGLKLIAQLKSLENENEKLLRKIKLLAASLVKLKSKPSKFDDRIADLYQELGHQKKITREALSHQKEAERTLDKYKTYSRFYYYTPATEIKELILSLSYMLKKAQKAKELAKNNGK